MRDVRDFSLVSLDSCSIHHSIYFRCDYFPCFDAGWPSLIFLSLRLLLSLFYSSVSLHLTSSDFFLFSSYLMFDLGSASTHHTCSFDVTIHLLSLFVLRPLGLGLMHEGYGDYIIGIFEPSFLSFLSPYYLGLRYVPCLKTTLMPLLHIVFDSSHVGNTRD